MGIGIGAAIIGSAVIGAGTAAYSSNEQSKLAKKQQQDLEAEQRRQQEEADRISRETRPEGETAGSTIKFGSMEDNTGSLSDFLVKNPNTKNNTSGLGASNNSGLGFVL